MMNFVFFFGLTIVLSSGRQQFMNSLLGDLFFVKKREEREMKLGEKTHSYYNSASVHNKFAMKKTKTDMHNE